MIPLRLPGDPVVPIACVMIPVNVVIEEATSAQRLVYDSVLLTDDRLPVSIATSTIFIKVVIEDITTLQIGRPVSCVIVRSLTCASDVCPPVVTS